jgi:hypothetical protein
MGAQQWVGLGLMGAGMAGMGIGAAPIPSQNECSNCHPPQTNPDMTPSAIAFAAGGVALASGLIVYFTAPRSKNLGFVVAPSPVAAAAAPSCEGVSKRNAKGVGRQWFGSR